MEGLARGGTLLLVCGDRRACSAMAERLRAEGHTVGVATTAAAADDALERGVDLTIVDSGRNADDADPLSLLGSLHTEADAPLVLLLPREHSGCTAQAMRLGATTVLPSPPDLQVLVMATARALESERQRRVARAARRRLNAKLADLVGESALMQQTRTLIERVAASRPRAVLVSGEPGTGKHLCARVLHGLGARRDGPFITISCAETDQDALARALFGCHREQNGSSAKVERGVLELAHGGTVLVAHVDRLGPSLQHQLLRLIEEGTVRRVGDARDLRCDVSVIAATSLDLRRSVENGSFRRDLFSRLSAAPIALPPLRERREDIRGIVTHELGELRADLGTGATKITPAAIRLLERHGWPGNVRELHNVVERAMLRAGDARSIDAAHVDLSRGIADAPPDYPLPEHGVELSRVERSLVIQALDRTSGNLTRAGRLLGLNRDQMRYRVEKFDLSEKLLKLRSGRRLAKVT